MASLVLTAAGSAIGGAILPGGLSVLGTTISGAAIGGALGGALGSAIDQRLFGPGAQVREGPRLTTLDVVSSSEGHAIPRVFGRMRVAGQVIWATRFRETATTTAAGSGGGGGKGGGLMGGGGASVETTTYSYSASFAIGLCEGPIAGLGRIWADGEPMDLSGVSWRWHGGYENQPADPLIAAITPDAPAFRGTAYIVFEDLPLDSYGNRVPQITVEVRRPPTPPEQHRDGPALPALIEGVAMSPGSGEFSLATTPVRRVLGEGVYAGANENNTAGATDFLVALDQLRQTAPNARSILLVVSWFGDDLRLGLCNVRPGVDDAAKVTEPLTWQVSGESRGEAFLVSRDGNGNPVYGGTPSDISVFEAIQEIHRRGLEVVFYPFILMDIPPGNAQGQPVFPWRGRIASDADGTLQAASDAASFFGAAQPGHFGAWDGNTVPYSGPVGDYGLRRMILHYARLCAAAGGVASFCIGSELRGVTRTRGPGRSYPSVEALKILARDVRGIVGAGTKISYAADWSEYANHRPADGSNDVIFHLDPLWADPDIDFVGIDNYLPLSDWRQGHAHIDAQSAESTYALDYLGANVEGGEYADWFYADEAARAAQARTPMVDAAHGEPWVFGVKRLREWWANPHHDRPDGVRSATPTAWVPGSKPIGFTETGCPAVDLGPNQPNVFYDPKSSESFFPYFSSGARDDAIQRRYLQAMLDHWRDDPMILGTWVWTWDSRPYPDYPLRNSVWTDGPNYEKGHWITGRLDAAPLAELVAEICAGAGEYRIDVSRLHALVDGYLIERTMSARDALQPLMLTFGFDAVESDGLIRFVPRGDPPVATLAESALVLEGGESPVSTTRAQETDLPRTVRIRHIRADAEYRRGSAEASLTGTVSTRIDESDQAVALTGGKALASARRWLAEARVARDTATFSLPPSRLALEPGDIVSLDVDGLSSPHRIARAETAAARAIEAVRVSPDVYRSVDVAGADTDAAPVGLVTPVLTVFADLPLLTGAEIPSAPRVAAFASPWPGRVAVYRSASEAGFALTSILPAPATLGRTLGELPVSAPGRWGEGTVEVRLSAGALLGADPLGVLAGENVLAIAHPDDGWEIMQFRDAELVAPLTYRLRGLLRGQAGTEHLIAPLPAGARVLLVDAAVGTLPLTDDQLDRALNYRYGPASQPFDAQTYRAQTLAFGGVGYRPYAPVHLRARETLAGDISLGWTRRSRFAADGWTSEPPLGEEAERYRVEITPALGSPRVLEPTTPSALYSAADRLADGAEGALDIRVAQVSAHWGAGPSAALTLPA